MSGDRVEGGEESYAYRVDLKIPFLTRTAEVNDDLLIGEVELFESSVRTVSPWAAVVGIKCNLWGDAICNTRAICCGGHDR